MGMRKVIVDVPMVMVRNVGKVEIHVGHKTLYPGKSLYEIAKDIAEKLSDLVIVDPNAVESAPELTFTEPIEVEKKERRGNRTFPSMTDIRACKYCGEMMTFQQLGPHVRKMHPKPKAKKGKKK